MTRHWWKLLSEANRSRVHVAGKTNKKHLPLASLVANLIKPHKAKEVV